ncbi:MAG: hypothetical protein R2733_12560 [Acidimicrobiales bacterium]
MRHHRRSFHLLIAGSALFLASCGSSGSDTAAGGSDGGSSEATTTTEAGPSPIYTESEFDQVCRGTGLEAAAGLSAETGVHPLVILEGEDPEYSYSSVTLPDGWEVEIGNYEATEMVACLNRVSATPVELCEGYEDSDSGISWSVQTFDATYELTLRDAKTAEVIATESFEGPSDGCPMFSIFSEGDPDPAPEYDVPSADIEVFLKDYVTGA